MEKGRIIKLTGGLYTVIDEKNQRHLVRPLGIFRHHNDKPKVGDICYFEDTTIHKLEARENDLVRPAIANIDQALLIQSSKKPDFSFLLLDKFLALIEQANVKPIIIITKVDLLSESEFTILKSKLKYYENFYRVIYFSIKTEEGKDEIKSLISGKVNVVSGQTGAGKSSLLNVLDPSLNLATDEISIALGRGKHTTRHVELIDFGNGWVADTPGFSKLEFQEMELNTLKDLYPDFFELSKECRFNECHHINEPNCKIKEAYENGQILKERYENYQKLYEELKLRKPKY